MWNLYPHERLREWKTFRQNLGQVSLDEACKSTTHLWSYAPFVGHYLDPNRTTSLNPWPDPWTLLYENHYCDIAKSLGMLYTLYLSDHRPDEIELVLGTDKKESYNLVCLAQGKYILNLSFDSVLNKADIPKDFEIKHRYNPQDLKLDQY